MRVEWLSNSCKQQQWSSFLKLILSQYLPSFSAVGSMLLLNVLKCCLNFFQIGNVAWKVMPAVWRAALQIHKCYEGLAISVVRIRSRNRCAWLFSGKSIVSVLALTVLFFIFYLECWNIWNAVKVKVRVKAEIRFLLTKSKTSVKYSIKLLNGEIPGI
jgi:hypothetical protein